MLEIGITIGGGILKRKVWVQAPSYGPGWAKEQQQREPLLHSLSIGTDSVETE